MRIHGSWGNTALTGRVVTLEPTGWVYEHLDLWKRRVLLACCDSGHFTRLRLCSLRQVSTCRACCGALGKWKMENEKWICPSGLVHGGGWRASIVTHSLFRGCLLCLGGLCALLIGRAQKADGRCFFFPGTLGESLTDLIWHLRQSARCRAPPAFKAPRSPPQPLSPNSSSAQRQSISIISLVATQSLSHTHNPPHQPINMTGRECPSPLPRLRDPQD